MAGGNSSLVNIHTLNINGLDKKMGKLTDFIKQSKIDILLLQETHIFDKVALERHLSNHGQKAIKRKTSIITMMELLLFIMIKSVPISNLIPM